VPRIGWYSNAAAVVNFVMENRIGSLKKKKKKYKNIMKDNRKGKKGTKKL